MIGAANFGREQYRMRPFLVAMSGVLLRPAADVGDAVGVPRVWGDVCSGQQ